VAKIVIFALESEVSQEFSFVDIAQVTCRSAASSFDLAF
jgi:hypothetical protein